MSGSRDEYLRLVIRVPPISRTKNSPISGDLPRPGLYVEWYYDTVPRANHLGAVPMTDDPIKRAKLAGRGSVSIPTDTAAWAPDESAPQFENDEMAKGGSGDLPSNSWLRGAGEDATRMPNFDHSGPSGHTKKGK